MLWVERLKEYAWFLTLNDITVLPDIYYVYSIEYFWLYKYTGRRKVSIQ